MTRRIEALYENGVLRPLEPIEGVAEHSRLTVTLEMERARPHLLADLVGTLPDEDAKEMRQAIEEEFERVDPDEWK
jgi:predicted DNA-binding antitoxin AbrB/MazE fold protein